MVVEVRPYADRSGRYEVSCGGPYYTCHPGEGASAGYCQCKAFRFRHSRRYELCKHLVALRDWLLKQEQCPICKGKGWLEPPPYMNCVDRYGNPDKAPAPCAGCGGSSKKKDVPPYLLEGRDAA